MSRSITAKLILAFLLVSVTGAALAAGIAYWQTRNQFKQLVFNQSREKFIADAAFYYQVNGSWSGVLDFFRMRNTAPSQTSPPLPGQVPGLQNTPPFVFLLADANGWVIIPAGPHRLGDLLPDSTLAGGVPVDVNGQQVGTVLVIGNPPPLGTLEQQYLRRTNLILLYAALGAAAMALVLGIVLARTLTHPLRDLTTAIHAMARGDLKQHVQVKSKDELGELAAAFNQMSADLDSLNQSRRQMTADIAHDLRNPLTVIGGYVESMRDGVLDPTPERFNTIHTEVGHLQRLVDDLRTLSQVEAKELSLNREALAPSALLERMVKSYRPLAAKQEINLKIEAVPGLPDLHADPERLAQVFGNLINNSLRHTPQGGEIVLFARREVKDIVLGVQDSGSGIPPELLPHIFERFRRGDPSRQDSGSGLGLAIAKALVGLHGGSISAESNASKGTTVKIRFHST